METAMTQKEEAELTDFIKRRGMEAEVRQFAGNINEARVVGNWIEALHKAKEFGFALYYSSSEHGAWAMFGQLGTVELLRENNLTLWKVTT